MSQKRTDANQATNTSKAEIASRTRDQQVGHNFIHHSPRTTCTGVRTTSSRTTGNPKAAIRAGNNTTSARTGSSMTSNRTGNGLTGRRAGTKVRTPTGKAANSELGNTVRTADTAVSTMKTNRRWLSYSLSSRSSGHNPTRTTRQKTRRVVCQCPSRRPNHRSPSRSGCTETNKAAVHRHRQLHHRHSRSPPYGSRRPMAGRPADLQCRPFFFQPHSSSSGGAEAAAAVHAEPKPQQ